MASLATEARRPGDGRSGPAALRPLGTFPPRRVSVFEDPGDERSWHVSQVFASLMRFYEGREPAWYATAVRQLAGCSSVVELGCGPSLALRTLREMGVRRVLGIDRWPGFVEVGRSHGVPVLMHDLTLPMPFLSSSGVDGVLSHYVLDYMSPIGVRQALREARRILRPGGQLLVYLAAIGRADGDETRSIRYTPEVLQRILADAGFETISVEAPGRNTVAQARAPSAVAESRDAAVAVDGETQLSAGYVGDATEIVAEVVGEGWRIRHELRLDTAGAEAGGALELNRTAVTVRLQRAVTGVWELQTCAWRDGVPANAGAMRLPGRPHELALGCEAPLDHTSVWTPRPLALAPPWVVSFGGDPQEVTSPHPGFQVTSELPAAGDLEKLTALDLRHATHAATPDLDAAWLEGRLHAIAIDVDAGRLGAAEPRVAWASVRSAPVLVFARSWGDVVEAAAATALGAPPPVIVIDPVLSGHDVDSNGFGRALEVARILPHLHLAAAETTLATAARPLDCWAPVVVAMGGGEPASIPADPSENLRYLCERALLMRLRATSRRTREELGRLPPLESAPAGTGQRS